MIKRQDNYDAEQVVDLSNVLGKNYFTRKIQEYQIWNTGNSDLIRAFYIKNPFSSNLNYFWQLALDKTIKRHTGIPKLISNKMGTIIFGAGFKPEVTVYKAEDGQISKDKNEEESNKAQDVLNALFDKTKAKEVFHLTAVKESWCGEGFIKFNYNLDLSQYPIIEASDLTQAEAIVERGVTTAIIFKTRYVTEQKEKYRYEEKYTTDENGDALIVNTLYQILVDGKEKEVPLTTIPQTAELEEYYRFEGLKGMIAFHKPNKKPNNEFPGSVYGASDYQGAIDSFDALDEAYSELVSEIRNNKTIRYMPTSMIPKDEDGNELAIDMAFITNYQLVGGSMDQNANNQMLIQTIDDKTVSLIEKYKNCLITAINLAGLSPLALGITGLEAINAGEQSQKERNRVTLETRKDKINNYWKPFLSELTLQLLAFNNWLVKKAGAKQEGLDVEEVNFDNADITFDFGEYVVEDETNVITRWATAKTSGLASVETCVKKLHPDWTDDQILDEVTKIKFENNMGMEDPTLLQMEFNTDGNIGVDDDGEDTQ
ncbi:MAG: hypothetical protein NC182_01670 [Prevotella sp.]|nr:hypothetical protein [Staphylococcus sp.]MCM1349891.1 hypothetical protein [Prevotella sp.]